MAAGAAHAVPPAATLPAISLPSDVTFCFAPGTDPKLIAEYERRLASILPARFYTGASWNSGGGAPVDLTWSFVPDGLAVDGGTSVLFGRMDTLFASKGGRAAWIAQLESAFDRWSALCGARFTRVHSGTNDWDDGAAWGSAASTTRGDIRVAAIPIDDAYGILAYARFPTDGDLVLDSSEPWANATDNFLFLRNTVMHELGHSIGLAHVCPTNDTKLMEPALVTAIDGPQHDDIRGAQSLYGDAIEDNDSPAAGVALGTLVDGAPTVAGPVPAPDVSYGSRLAIESTGDVDYFKFTLAAEGQVTAVLTPLGLTYDSSREPNNLVGCYSGNFVNSLSAGNLNVQLLSGDGGSLLASAASQPAGAAETLSNVSLAAGTYCVRVYSASGSSPQLYTLSLSYTPPAQPSWYRDADGDTYGDPNTVQKADVQPADYVAGHTDCDDTAAAAHPGATELCDALDNDCDGTIDDGLTRTPWYRDTDGDLHGDPNATMLACAQPSGYVADNTDCDDQMASAHPGAAEICDGRDNNCDGAIDELVPPATWYRDSDGDGYGHPNVGLVACQQPVGYVADKTDCDDNDANVHPNAAEACDGRDNDCDGRVDESACEITLSPAAVDFGQLNPHDPQTMQPHTLTILRSGQTFHYAVDPGSVPAWLSVLPTSGSSSGGQAVMSLAAKYDTLVVGQMHQAELRVTIDDDVMRTVVVSAAALESAHTLTLQLSGPGRVRMSGAVQLDSTAGTTQAVLTVPAGQTPVLQAETVGACDRFVGWEGSVSSTEAGVTVPMTGDMTITAVFTAGQSLDGCSGTSTCALILLTYLTVTSRRRV